MKHFPFDRLSIRLAGVEGCRQLFEPIFADRSNELLLGALLDDKATLIELVGVPGDTDSIEVDPAVIWRRAITLEAAGIILAHNHPSGDNNPSRSDKIFTRALTMQGEALGIELVDHLLFDHKPVYSMRQHGFL